MGIGVPGKLTATQCACYSVGYTPTRTVQPSAHMQGRHLLGPRQVEAGLRTNPEDVFALVHWWNRRSEDWRKALDGPLHLMPNYANVAETWMLYPSLKRVLNKLGCMWMYNYLCQLGFSTIDKIYFQFEAYWSDEELTEQVQEIDDGMAQLRQERLQQYPTNLTELMELIFRHRHNVIEWQLFPAYNKLPFPLNLILPNVSVWGFSDLDSDLQLFYRWNPHSNVSQVKVRCICELACPLLCLCNMYAAHSDGRGPPAS